MHFGKFNDVESDLNVYSKHEDTKISGFATMLLQIMKNAQRFYVPDACNIVGGKEFDESMKRMMHLPFDTVVVLSDTYIRETKEPTWVITFAVDARSNSNISKLHGEFVDLSKHYEQDENTWVIYSMLYVKEMDGIRKGFHGWTPMPLAYTICSYPDKGIGYKQAVIEIMNHGKSYAAMCKEFSEDVTTIQNLCAMLALKNVKSRTVKAPEKLNKKRIKNGNLPLYDYHILEVDGELWDKNEFSGQDSGTGVRSHLRRGHIRHLNVDRAVWVRATIVKGSVPGFVNKDYQIGV